MVPSVPTRIQSAVVLSVTIGIPSVAAAHQSPDMQAANRLQRALRRGGATFGAWQVSSWSCTRSRRPGC